MRRPYFLLLAILLLTVSNNDEIFAKTKTSPFENARRVLFLGDSITHAGGYIAWIETQLRMEGVDPLPEIINLGLSSETCNGLSEPTHPFPRPNVHERLKRALAKIQPDLVVACYGMNDGIYHPYSDNRLQAYQQGVKKLIDVVHAHDAKLILMTPPPFDPIPVRKKGKLLPASADRHAYNGVYEHYDQDVIRVFAEWIMTNAEEVEMVIDLHTPLTQHLKEQRQTNPDYVLAGDGVHPNATGHRIIAKTILNACGYQELVEPPSELLKMMQQKTRILHDAWLSDVGHLRPGVKPGLPVAEAQKQVAELEAKIQSMMTKK